MKFLTSPTIWKLFYNVAGKKARLKGRKDIRSLAWPATRKLLSAAGVYGARLSIHHVEGEALPYPDGVFNLIAADAAGGATAARPEELFRVLKPWGGVLVAGVCSSGHQCGVVGRNVYRSK